MWGITHLLDHMPDADAALIKEGLPSYEYSTSQIVLGDMFKALHSMSVVWLRSAEAAADIQNVCFSALLSIDPFFFWFSSSIVCSGCFLQAFVLCVCVCLLAPTLCDFFIFIFLNLTFAVPYRTSCLSPPRYAGDWRNTLSSPHCNVDFGQ